MYCNVLSQKRKIPCDLPLNDEARKSGRKKGTGQWMKWCVKHGYVYYDAEYSK